MLEKKKYVEFLIEKNSILSDFLNVFKLKIINNFLYWQNKILINFIKWICWYMKRYWKIILFNGNFWKYGIKFKTISILKNSSEYKIEMEKENIKEFVEFIRNYKIGKIVLNEENELILKSKANLKN